MPLPTTTKSITLVKRFTYRGVDEEWSNTYHFSGTAPASNTEWKALADAIFSTEKACYQSTTKLVRAYGYLPPLDVSVAQIDYVALGGALPAGTLLTESSDSVMAGDQASMLRAPVGLSTRGKKVYLRKYFHGGTIKQSDPDNIALRTTQGLTAHGAAMIGGGLPGGAKWCSPSGALPTLTQPNAFVTTRTLKRRGKRPH